MLDFARQPSPDGTSPSNDSPARTIGASHHAAIRRHWPDPRHLQPRFSPRKDAINPRFRLVSSSSSSRSIEVKVNRKGVRAYAQRQYMPAGQAPAAPAVTLDATVGGVLPNAGTRLALNTTAFAKPDGEGAVVTIQVDAGAFAAEVPDTPRLQCDCSRSSRPTGRLGDANINLARQKLPDRGYGTCGRPEPHRSRPRRL